MTLCVTTYLSLWRYYYSYLKKEKTEAQQLAELALELHLSDARTMPFR